MLIVVGSGPAAIAATHALLQQGQQVTILDVGKRLEPDRQAIVDRMSCQEPEAWSNDDLATILGKRSVNTEIVHSKLSYGSSYSFGSNYPDVDIRWSHKEGFNHSPALGGLSNVWGSSLLSYRQQDITDWPVSIKDLEPHYRAVMEFVPGTAIIDDLEEILPTYSDQNNPLNPSRQGQAFLDDLEKQKQPLRKAGIVFGRSRLAIRASGSQHGRACNYCALCLSGCPYGLIYSSAQSLHEWVRNGSVRYLDGHLVEKFEQVGDEVIVTGRLLSENTSFNLRAKRVWIGAGVLPTAKIVLHSLGMLDHPIKLVDSQYFVYPLLRFTCTDGVESEKMHTSSQVFLEIDDPSVSNHLIHLQIYGFSTFLLQELKRTFLRIPLQIASFRRQFLGRLLIAQAYIHSNESATIQLTLKKAGSGRIFLDARIPKPRKALLKAFKVGWKLLSQSLRLRAIPLIPGLQFPKPGSGYHSGGSFPMRKAPGPLETDTLGRLPSMDRVHLIDASVLPSIPATSITFSMMANAHRIASASGKLDSP